MSSPWKTNILPEPVNLQDVILEELNKSYQEKEDIKLGVFAFSENEEIEIPKEALRYNEQLRSDEEIAKMLQQKYDNECCDISKQPKGKFNSALKVSLTLHDQESSSNFDFDSDYEHEELEDIRDKNEWDKFSAVLEKFDPIPAYNSGNSIPGNNIVRVNNETISKILSFPWIISPGSDFVRKKRTKRVRHEWGWCYHYGQLEDVPLEYGVDHQTKMILYNMVKDQLISHINGMISLGEDALILHARTNVHYKKRSLPAQCAVKIFKITLGESKRKDRFLKEDYRFKGMWKKKSGELDMVKTACYWAQKEMDILQRLRKAGVLCPEVITLKRNILVMSYLNSSDNCSTPAPKLKNADLSSAEMVTAYEQVSHYMKLMYNECNLIHGDLSATNILWHDNKCYIIDVSQFVRRTHEQALLLLYKDCNCISEFFISKDVPNIATPEELFMNITGYDPRNRFIWEEYQKSLKIKTFSDVKLRYSPKLTF